MRRSASNIVLLVSLLVLEAVVTLASTPGSIMRRRATADRRFWHITPSATRLSVSTLGRWPANVVTQTGWSTDRAHVPELGQFNADSALGVVRTPVYLTKDEAAVYRSAVREGR